MSTTCITFAENLPQTIKQSNKICTYNYLGCINMTADKKS